MPFEVRNRETTLTFEGVKVAHVSAELPSKQRWSEFTIYLTSHQEWVLQGVGRTRVPGETDRFWSVISQDPVDVLDSIVGNDVSRLAKKLIAESLLALRDTLVPAP
jgi:hypothetical protein